MDNTNSLPFDYVVTATTGAAAGSTVSTTLIMQADSRFELMAILATGGNTASTEDSLQYPNSFTVSIRDQTTGRDLMSAPVPQRILCGNAYRPLTEKRGIIFEPQSNLLFTFTNLAGGATNSITLVLKGYKIIL